MQSTAGITRDNWRTWPHLREGVLAVRSLVPSRPIAPAARASSLQSRPIDLSGIRIQAGGRDLNWSDFLSETHVDGLAVVHDGGLAFETYRGGLTADQPHLGFSIAKSIVGLLAELLIFDGSLDEQADAGALVPELRSSAFGSARLRDLLDMVDGAPFDETYADPGAQIHRYSQSYWGEAAAGHGVLAALAALPTGRASPSGFAYRTPVADVVGWMIRRAVNRPLTDLISERIWRPIGAEHPAYLLLDRAGDEIAGTGFGATLRDLARLGRVLADMGRLEGKLVFPEAVIRKIIAGGSPAAMAHSAPASRPGWTYKSLWWATGDGRGSFTALGVFGQRLYVSPARRFVVARFGSYPSASNAETDELHAAAFEAVYNHLSSSEGGSAT